MTEMRRSCYQRVLSWRLGVVEQLDHHLMPNHQALTSCDSCELLSPYNLASIKQLKYLHAQCGSFLHRTHPSAKRNFGC